MGDPETDAANHIALLEMERDGLRLMVADLERRLAKTRAAFERLRGYAAGVWFDEADAVDEECEEMQHARDALKEKDPPG